MNLHNFLLFTAFMLLSSTVFSQKQITGKVIDSNDSLEGVSIYFEGTTIGTTSDVNGEFSIQKPENSSTLIFSYLGFIDQKVEVTTQDVVDITMVPDLESLDEIVVIGYGSQIKNDITGAVSVVNVEEITKTYSASLTDQLQGRVAGVSVNTSGKPGSIGDIKIRGASFFGGNNPLYVIDGILSGDNPTLNPADIASVQVLKDASASAIYGNRAANGVIIITTKKGEVGSPKINFNSTIGTQFINSRIPLGDNFNWARIVNAAHDNAGAPRVTGANEGFDPAINTDWQEKLFDNFAPTNNINLSVSAGGENNKLYFSLNNFRQEGAIEGPKFERISSRINTEFEIAENLVVGEHLSIGRSKLNGVAGAIDSETDGDIITPFSAAFEMLPVIPVYDDTQPSGYGIGEIGVAQTWSENPIGVMDLYTNTSERLSILGDVYLNYEFFDGLDYRFSLGLNSSYTNFKSYNEAGQIRMSTPHFSGLTESRIEERGVFFENRLSYSKSVNKNNFSIMGAVTEQSSTTKILSSTSLGGYDNEVNFWQLSNSTGSISSSGSEFNSAIRSFLGRITYDYDKKYYLTASMRRDGSSKFSEENRWGNFPSFSLGWNISKENFFDYPAINNFKFRAGYGVVGNASIGDYEYITTIYRTAMGSSLWTPGVNYNLGPTSVSIIGATRSDNLRNNDISWEELSEVNIGIDLEMFDSKFLLSADYFFGDLSDLLASIPLPGSVGTTVRSQPSINAVSMERKGWEASIAYRNYKNELKFSISANLFGNNNEITELGYGLTELVGTNTSSKTTARVGSSVGEFYLLDYLGIYTPAEIFALPDNFTIQGERPQVGDAKYRDVSGRDENGLLTGVPDGKINLNDDRVVTGSPIPKAQFGFNLDFNYKIFDLNLFFQGVSGRDIYNSYHSLMTSEDYGHFTNYPTYYDPYIAGEGTDPRPHFFQGHGNNLESTRYLENGAYVKLKNFQFGLNIPNKKFDKLRVFIGGQNLFTLTEYRGLDPEFDGNSIFTPGIDPRQFPSLLTFTTGFEINF